MMDMGMDQKEAPEKDDPKYGKFDEYEIKCAADAVKEVEELKRDPEKLKYVQEYLKHEAEETSKAAEAISSIDDIRQVLKKKQAKV
jgi:hypothetical protein